MTWKATWIWLLASVRPGCLSQARTVDESALASSAVGSGVPHERDGGAACAVADSETSNRKRGSFMDVSEWKKGPAPCGGRPPESYCRMIVRVSRCPSAFSTAKYVPA